uniref:ATP synthase F0 subunit 8 n=1 Tax=Scurria scurra TaxID=351200 RepID=UPI001EDE636D|nr:ATP synthase F0 subunit 8 [Scurria scurra]UHY95076.1 ATP synthase F0 subunit 8 [Scurria scurra]
MPQLGPVEWLMVFGLVWSTISGVMVEIYSGPVSSFKWPHNQEKVSKTYLWRWNK